MIGYISSFIYIISQVLIWLVILSALLSFFMDPYHPIRRAIDQIVEPMLRPIRRVIPFIGNIDISPLILIIVIQFISFILRYFLSVL